QFHCKNFTKQHPNITHYSIPYPNWSLNGNAGLSIPPGLIHPNSQLITDSLSDELSRLRIVIPSWAPIQSNRATQGRPLLLLRFLGDVKQEKLS
ncbi:hypothetical protein CDAR_88221, partial [Caerostris darwini]